MVNFLRFKRDNILIKKLKELEIKINAIQRMFSSVVSGIKQVIQILENKNRD